LSHFHLRTDQGRRSRYSGRWRFASFGRRFLLLDRRGRLETSHFTCAHQHFEAFSSDRLTPFGEEAEQCDHHDQNERSDNDEIHETTEKRLVTSDQIGELLVRIAQTTSAVHTATVVVAILRTRLKRHAIGRYTVFVDANVVRLAHDAVREGLRVQGRSVAKIVDHRSIRDYVFWTWRLKAVHGTAVDVIRLALNSSVSGLLPAAIVHRRSFRVLGDRWEVGHNITLIEKGLTELVVVAQAQFVVTNATASVFWYPKKQKERKQRMSGSVRPKKYSHRTKDSRSIVARSSVRFKQVERTMFA
jgi:hypothetical protein